MPDKSQLYAVMKTKDVEPMSDDISRTDIRLSMSNGH